MKAIVHDIYGGPEVLRLADVPVPEPKPTEVRVRVLACAVNLSDWEYLVGSPFYARMVGGLLKPKSQILGSDIVGVVEMIGADVTGFALGDRVMGDLVMTRGGFAQYACVPAKEMVLVPESLSDEVAACLPQAGGIAVSGTEGLTASDRFLLNGAGGGSGTMALQLAKAAGAHVTVVDNTGKVDWLRTLGADAVIDYRSEDFATSGAEWTRILDMVATRGPGRIAGCLAKGGTYRALGGGVPTLLSLVIGGLPYRLAGKSIGLSMVPSGPALTKKVAKLAVEGHLAPLIADVQPLASVPEALRRTGAGEVKGKIVIRPGA